MASTRLQQAQILRSQPVLDQLTGSLLAAAAQVLNEAATTPDHQNRLAFANAIWMNPAQQAQFMMPALMTNSTLQAQAGNTLGVSGTPFSDGDVDYVVASVFVKYADQYAAQKISVLCFKSVRRLGV